MRSDLSRVLGPSRVCAQVREAELKAKKTEKKHTVALDSQKAEHEVAMKALQRGLDRQREQVEGQLASTSAQLRNAHAEIERLIDGNGGGEDTVETLTGMLQRTAARALLLLRTLVYPAALLVLCSERPA